MRKELFCMILLLMFVFGSCDSFNIPGQQGNDEQFLLLHYNAENKLAQGAYLSVMTVNKGTPKDEKLAEIFPSSMLHTNADIMNKRVAIGLHSTFNVPGTTRQTNGGWFDLSSNSWVELPLLAAGTGRYAYFDLASPKVSESGHIFYLSASNDKDYHDQYRASLVRYNPKTKELLQAIDPTGFVKAQPEKGWDTEAGQFKNQFYPSKDGRYVYGVVDAFGVDGGAIHWDYRILFKYDFEKEQYTRMGDAEDRNVTIMGITADRNEVAYISSVSNVFHRKLVNTSSNMVRKTTISGGQSYANTSRWNNNGYCSGETNNTIGIYDMISNTKHDIKTKSRPYFAQFSVDGSRVYFMIQSTAAKYLCRTSDLTAEATIDTLCTLPQSVNEFVVVR